MSGRLVFVRTVVVALLGPLALWVAPVTAQAGSNPWAQITKRDLAAIRQTLLENHPGPVDPLNPDYRNWLEDGYQRAMAMADSVESLDGVVATLSFYTSGFEDGHLAWGSSFERSEVIWPGFVVALRGGRFIVDRVAPGAAKGGIAVGAEVLSCDGERLHDRLVNEVMPFYEGIPTLEASRVRLAPRVLVDDRNPFIRRPHKCRVRADAQGPTTEVELAWQWIGRAELESMMEQASYGNGVQDFAILHPADGVAWITIPSFNETKNQNRAGLEKVIAGLPAVRNSRLIVFDVRGNRGGNSAWAYHLLVPLFGKEYVQKVEEKVGGREYVEWRASKSNADFIERSTVPRYAPGSPGRESMQALVDTLRKAAAAGEDLVRIGTLPPSGQATKVLLPPDPLGKRVILLTDGWCASACLDFADQLLAIPGVRHAGAPTYADAAYIDNRGITLPSHLGYFTFSMKVYRDRPRGNNEPYVPTLRYNGDRWNLGALQQWLLGVAQ